MVYLNQDMCSFNAEQARGEYHNTISYLMINRNMNVHEAMGWLAGRHAMIVENILRCLEEELPWKIGTGTEIAQYIEGMMTWVRADTSWSFTTKRYFGDKVLEVRKSRVVTLLPRQETAASDKQGPSEIPYHAPS